MWILQEKDTQITTHTAELVEDHKELKMLGSTFEVEVNLEVSPRVPTL